MFRKFLPLIKSMIASFISFALDYGLLYVLTEYLSLYYLISGAISFTLASTLNFYLCAVWVFPSGRSGGKQYISFLIVGTVGLVLNTLFMALFTDVFLIHYMISKPIAASLVFFWNYFMRRYAIFKA